jgi:hypothetical protein
MDLTCSTIVRFAAIASGWKRGRVRRVSAGFEVVDTGDLAGGELAH